LLLASFALSLAIGAGGGSYWLGRRRVAPPRGTNRSPSKPIGLRLNGARGAYLLARRCRRTNARNPATAGSREGRQTVPLRPGDY